jgi:hypothetical protein
METCQSLHLNQLSTNQSSASKYWTHARKCYRDPCRLSFPQRACSQATPRVDINYTQTLCTLHLKLLTLHVCVQPAVRLHDVCVKSDNTKFVCSQSTYTNLHNYIDVNYDISRF